MKILIHADMEGISGINRLEQVRIGGPAYDQGCRLLAREMNVLIDACFRHGATEVMVSDTHGGGGNLVIDQLDPRAGLDIPTFPNLITTLDETYDAVFLPGHHAMAGTHSAFLEHSFSSQSVYAIRINGREIGEIGIESLFAADIGVPTLLVSGDQATAAETARELPDAEAVIVKYAKQRNRCTCLSLNDADRLLSEAVERVLTKLKANGKPEVKKLDWPCQMERSYYRTDQADEFCDRHTRAERVDGRTVRWEARNRFEFLQP